MAGRGFTIGNSYLERIAELSCAAAGRLFRALTDYHLTKEAAALRGREAVLFDLIRRDMDEEERRYAKRCAVNRANRNRYKSGSPAGGEKDGPSRVLTNGDDSSGNAEKPEVPGKGGKTGVYIPYRSDTLKREKETGECKGGEEKETEILFGRFWQAYPRRVAKEAARKAFRRLKPDEALIRRMEDALREQQGQWQDPRYIPYPATWLNQRRWEDEVPVCGNPGTPAGRTPPARQCPQRDYSHEDEAALQRMLAMFQAEE